MIKYILPLLFLLFLSSCATIFTPKTQKVMIKTQSPNASVYVNDVFAGKGETVSSILKRDGYIQNIKIKEQGYQDANYTIVPTKRPAIYWLNILSIPCIGVGFIVDGNVARGFNYKEPFEIPQRTIAVSKQSTQKYVYLTKSSFDVPKEKLRFIHMSYKDYQKNKTITSKKSSYMSNEKWVVDNTIFSDDMNNILKENGFIDTTGTLLKSQTNTLYVKVIVDSLTIKRVSKEYTYGFVKSELGLIWEIQDIYQQTKYKFKTTSNSDEYIDDNDGFM